MLLRNCPEKTRWLEYISIPHEMSFFQRSAMRLHGSKCEPCLTTIAALQKEWNSLFSGDGDLTPSLMRVLSKLKNDETLILKGWKLGNVKPRVSTRQMVRSGWVFRGAISIALVAVVSLVMLRQRDTAESSAQTGQSLLRKPLAQFRFENQNGIKVHYVQPELVESIEFRTTGTRR